MYGWLLRTEKSSKHYRLNNGSDLKRILGINKMRHLGLFEGIGGFSLAAEWAGWKTVAWCEWNEFCQKVLRHHFPNATGHGDITKTDFTQYANRIDIITGGFPCQPYSVAGKQKGKEDDRHLWPEMLRAIREVRPRWVVGENVFGLVNWSGGLVFHEVQHDLEVEGYEVWPYVLPACAVEAEHRRDRIFFIAHNEGFALEKQKVVFPARSVSEPREPAKRLPASVWRFNRETYLSEMAGDVHGVSSWVDRSKALGNAIVPQVALQIFKAINVYEQSRSR